MMNAVKWVIVVLLVAVLAFPVVLGLLWATGLIDQLMIGRAIVVSGW